MKRVELAGLAVEENAGAPIVVLREHDEPHRLLPILIGGPEAAAIAMAAAGQQPVRPMSHDLMADLVRDLGGRLDAVEVTDLSEGTYAARLTVNSPTGEHWIDARPSDAIALALRLDAPVFVSDEVLDRAGELPVDEFDEASAAPVIEVDGAALDEAIEEFRAFLDDVDASQFEQGDGDPDDDADDDAHGDPDRAADDS